MRALIVALIGAFAIGMAGETGLRDLAAQRDFYVGAAVNVDPLEQEPEYREILAREFNIIVGENAFKFDKIHPERDRYDFSGADAIVDFAAEHGMKLRGHTLVWHRQLPRWITEGDFTREEAIEILTNHIETVVGRYRGKIWAWDVVNEAVDDSRDKDRSGLQLLEDSFWYRTIGPEYISMAFEIAHRADPDAILYYNDFSNEGMGNRSTAVYRLVSDLKRRGVPVDGVGFQMHITPDFKLKNEHRDNVRRLAELGLEVSITELDVRLKLPVAPDTYRKQAAAYREAARFCLTEPACRSLVLWGFTDKHSWIPEFFPGEDDALIYDRDYQPKPGYASLRDALGEAARGFPLIHQAELEGRDLLIAGETFDREATLYLNYRPLKTSSVKMPDAMGLVGRDAARLIAPGETVRLQVRNGDGKLSPEYLYTREEKAAERRD